MKKLLSLVLAVVMLLACANLASASSQLAGTYDVTVWVAEKVVDLTRQQIDAFNANNAFGIIINATVEPVSEADAATNMITDVEGGADIFGFAQDQLARLVAAGALTPAGDDAAWITEQNDAGAVSAATMGGQIFAYPITSDNGYFLYYDKSVVKDPSTLEGIIADCEAAGKGFYMEINSGWYQTAFFFGTGCKMEFETDDTGNFTGANMDYASDKGVAALKKMIELHKSKAFNNGSSVSNAANCAAIVDGTWDAQAAKDMFGENYATAKLPTFNVDGTDYQMSGFGGFKLLGVKPQTDPGKLAVCRELAKYLSSEEVQVARYNAVFWGPSNKAAQQNEAVKADEALSALAEQLQYTIPQGQYPNDYWSISTSLGDSVIAGDYDSADDAKLLEALQSFQDQVAAIK